MQQVIAVRRWSYGWCASTLSIVQRHLRKAPFFEAMLRHNNLSETMASSSNTLGCSVDQSGHLFVDRSGFLFEYVSWQSWTGWRWLYLKICVYIYFPSLTMYVPQYNIMWEVVMPFSVHTLLLIQCNWLDWPSNQHLVDLDNAKQSCCIRFIFGFTKITRSGVYNPLLKGLGISSHWILAAGRSSPKPNFSGSPSGWSTFLWLRWPSSRDFHSRSVGVFFDLECRWWPRVLLQTTFCKSQGSFEDLFFVCNLANNYELVLSTLEVSISLQLNFRGEKP